MTTSANTLKIVIADDIQETLDMVCSITAEICPEGRIVARCSSLAATREAISHYRPDIVLSDICFAGEGMTIFDLLDEYKNNDDLFFSVIVFSGHYETRYYDMAFCYNAIHFLCKPIEKQRLREAIDRIRQYSSRENEKKILRKLTVRTATATHFVSLTDIVSFRSHNSGTNIMLSNSTSIFSSRNIGYYQKEIADVRFFLRIHESTIVNLNYVTGFTNSSDRMAILTPPYQNLKCSKEGYRRLMEAL